MKKVRMRFFRSAVTVDDAEPKDDGSNSSPPPPARHNQRWIGPTATNEASGTVVLRLLRLETTLQWQQPPPRALPPATTPYPGSFNGRPATSQDTAYTRSASGIAAWESDLLFSSPHHADRRAHNEILGAGVLEPG